MAFVAGFISVASFLGLAISAGSYGEAVRKVVIADAVAIVCLGIAALLYWLGSRQG
ncbi:MAG: hypothetical protein K0S46_1208 [Moraxellaceae bacterium]|jgi:hypothetical protein|nr:hypothetical protein [Moraxellaceae bacterium]